MSQNVAFLDWSSRIIVLFFIFSSARLSEVSKCLFFVLHAGVTWPLLLLPPGPLHMHYQWLFSGGRIISSWHRKVFWQHTLMAVECCCLAVPLNNVHWDVEELGVMGSHMAQWLEHWWLSQWPGFDFQWLHVISFPHSIFSLMFRMWNHLQGCMEPCI